MTQNPLFDEMQVHPKRSLGHVSAALEAIATAAPAGVLMLTLVQQESYYSALSERYERLAQAGATVIIGYSGEAPKADGVHHVDLERDGQLSMSWAVTVLGPDFGAYLTAEDLVTFDPRESSLEPGREFAAAWGFDRIKAAEVTGFYLQRMESELPEGVVKQVRSQISQSTSESRSPAEAALAASNVVTLDRVISLETNLARAIQELDLEAQAASQDPLTQLLNRRGFDRWSGSNEPSGATLPSVGLILIDLDDFKAVNDQMGHLVGDQLLQEIAQALRDETRPSDIVCRWGGDEFLVACPGTETEKLAEVAERLVKAISAINVDGMSVNASAGLHVGTLSELGILEADRALYGAKLLGGGSVVSASDLPN
jgi:diguanylate cyclase (GGDEF)-like protein